MAGNERTEEAWRDNRAYLVNLAFGMLGDIGSAEDAVQEAFARLAKSDVDAIDDPRGWLIVVTSRICLDQLASARARRERPQDADSMEYVGEAVSTPTPVDPADRVTLDDEVSTALLVVLHRLTPAERVAFLLHDVFSLPFETIAATVGRTAPSCRQLARRARAKVREADALPLSADSVSTVEHRRVVERFITASANG